MRKIILMAVAGYLWKSFKARRTAGSAEADSVRPFPETRGTVASRTGKSF